MALSPAELATVAEMLRLPVDDADLVAGAAALTAAQLITMSADVVTWNANRNDVDVWLSGAGGVNWEAQRLLDRIAQRTGDALGVSVYSIPTFFALAPGTRGF